MSRKITAEQMQHSRELYKYLSKHHLGIENGIKRKELAEKLDIPERALRKYTSIINASSEFEKLVSTNHSCYVCDSKAECAKAINNTYNVAVSLFLKGKKMEKKVGLNGQIKIDLGDEYKDIVETFSKNK